MLPFQSGRELKSLAAFDLQVRAARADLDQENEELKKKLAKAKLDAMSWRMAASHKEKQKQDRER